MTETEVAVEQDRARLDVLDRRMTRLLDRHLAAMVAGDEPRCDRLRSRLDRVVAEREVVLTRLGRGRAPSTATEARAAAAARLVEARELDDVAGALIDAGEALEQLVAETGQVPPPEIARMTTAARAARGAARHERVRAAHRLETAELTGRN